MTLPAEPLVLASGSPRRAALLQQIGIPHVVRLPAVPVDETPLPGEAPADYVLRLARAKALAVAAPGRLVLAADTTVVADGQILGKPEDRAAAEAMLVSLSDRVHAVLTGVALRRDADLRAVLVRTDVRFRAISAREASAYAAMGEGADKAGGYAIQGQGAIFVQSLAGSYSNVVGLPLAETETLLQAFGVDTWAWRLAPTQHSTDKSDGS
jgi:septum formation protein